MPVKCMDFLASKRRPLCPPLVVLFGDEPFLKRQAHDAVQTWAVGPEPDDFSDGVYAGDAVELRDVLDAVRTPPFLGERKLVTVENADDFISKHREGLLRYTRAPSTTGVLLLITDAWPMTTNLAKQVEGMGLAIECKAPQAWHVAAWCVQWAKHRHGKTMAKATADWLVELVGTDLGRLDQELCKLAVAAGAHKTIELESVQRLVAGTRVESAFKLLEMLLQGETGKAIQYLDRLMIAGESPVGIVAMISAQLRKLTKAAREVVMGQPMPEALKAAGIPPFALERSEAQLRHFGRARMAAMYRQLLTTDLALKGGSALPPRTIVERFFLDLARKGEVLAATGRHGPPSPLR